MSLLKAIEGLCNMPGGILTQFVMRLDLRSIVFIGALLATNGIVVLAQGTQELTLSASFSTQQPLTPRQRIELKLNRPLAAADGKLAVMVGLMDVTALLDIQSGLVSYSPKLPLPAGETELAVYLVSADYRWNEIARFPLNITGLTTASPSVFGETSQVTVEQPASSTNTQAEAQPRRRWGFDKIEMSPTATIQLKSQIAERHFPESSRPDRPIFTDVAMQSSMSASLARGAFNVQSKFDFAGSSFQQEALRFGELGSAAPQIDLASYQVQTQLPTPLGSANISLGHLSYGSQRHLVNNFSSRGLTATIPLGTRMDFSAAAMNGTSIVGWNNFFGLNRRKHQIISGVFGFELDRERRGAQRIEVGVSHGSLLPLNNFSQRTITDAERSFAGTIRLLWSDKSQRVRLDAGLSRSRFTNPADPLLNQGVNVVPVREETRNAHYVDASVTLLRDYQFTAQKKINLAFNLRHEKLDPFFRTIGVIAQADRFQNQFEFTGSIGDFTATVGHTRFHDNLDDIPSVLKTLTRRNNLIIGGPLQTLFSNIDQPLPWARWWPRISYILDHVHQLGSGIPINAEFRPDLVPDQISVNHNFTAEWQFEKWRAAYRFNRSFQNNRQPGRDFADFLNLINGVTIGYTPRASFDLNLDINAEQAKNFELSRLDRTLRFAVITNWRMTSRSTLSLNLSTIGAGDLARTSDSRAIEGDAQWSYRFGYEQTRWKKFQGQFFVRYANRFARSRDRVFLLNNLVRTWTVNLGVSFTY